MSGTNITVCREVFRVLAQVPYYKEEFWEANEVADAILAQEDRTDPEDIIRELLATANDSEAARDHEAIDRAEARLAENGK